MPFFARIVSGTGIVVFADLFAQVECNDIPQLVHELIGSGPPSGPFVAVPKQPAQNVALVFSGCKI